MKKQEMAESLDTVTHTSTLNNKGITLISLVITIIILLILAGISIAQLTGNGLFEKAKTAKEEYKNAQEYEEIEIARTTNQINGYIDGDRDNVTIPKEEYEKLNRKEVWELLATTTNTTATEYEVKDLKEFSEYALVVYNFNDDLVASTIVTYTLFTTIKGDGLFANYNNGTSYVGYAKYVSDTKIKLKKQDKYTGEVRFYGIY